MPRPRILRRLARWLLLALAAFFLGSTLLIVSYGVVPPPITPLMLIRLFDGEGLRRDWVAYDRISPNLVRAVISAEDARFCDHRGIDWKAVERAWERNQSGRRTYGASTITMQTAKNLFLWPRRSWLRKGLELYFTVLIELFLDKQRIMELYLNIVEWGRGVYGVEVAAQAHFGKPADRLSAHEAALLAAILPNPREWSASRPGGFVAGKAATIQARMRAMPEAVDPLCR